MLMVCLLLLVQEPVPLAPQEGSGLAAQAAQAEAWMRLPLSQRILSRNLFLATRGTASGKPGTSSPSDPALPALLGTQLGPEARGALLKWPGAEESVFLAPGETHLGWTLKAVQRDRAILVGEASGKQVEVSLEAEPGTPSGPASDWDSLLRRPPAKPTGTP